MKQHCFNAMLFLAATFLASCGDDAEPVNRPPDPVTVTTKVNGNTVEIQWTAATDPDGDAITYDVVVGADLVAEKITETRFVLNDLKYETPYQAKVVTRDKRGANAEASFEFTTGFLFMKSFEVSGREYVLRYDAHGALNEIETTMPGGGAILRNGAGQVIGMGEMNYEYNSSGLMSKVKNATREATLQNDDKDRLIRIRCRYSTGPSSTYVVIRDHTYNDAGQLIRVKEDVSREGTTTREYATFNIDYDARGNVIRVMSGTSTDDISYTPSVTTVYTYDNKKNPWYTILSQQTNFGQLYIPGNLLIRPTIVFGHNNNFWTHWTSPNNVIKSESSSATGSSVNTITYTYNDEGYPVTIEDVFASSGSVAVTSYLRYYY